MTRKQIKELDKLWSRVVRARGACEKCGKTTALHAHHIYYRRHYSTRWLPENGVCLCYRCHMFWAHKDPVEFTDWVRERVGVDVIERLRVLTQDGTKQDYDDVLLMLTEAEVFS